MDLLDKSDVLAAIDARLAQAEGLIDNQYAKQADRRVLASNISALRKVREDVEGLPLALRGWTP
jgi:hypothetical protein